MAFAHEDPRQLHNPHPWTEKLLTLDRCRPTNEPPVTRMITGITTLLRWREWEEAMAGHPDRRFREYIALGIHQGFRIGFDRRSGVAPRSCR
ncbi:hypothetical protein GBAR_LOCUS22339, partial [Geodia barretti]